MTISGYWRVITSNGIPSHPIGRFPLVSGVDAEEDCCCGRPFDLMEQDYTFVMPAYSATGSVREAAIWPMPSPPFIGEPHATFGVAVNGIPFDPYAAEWWDRSPGNPQWQLNPFRHPDMATDFDRNNGHVQADGAYHYHGLPTMLYRQIQRDLAGDPVTADRSEIVLLGWAFDGNPIYGPKCGRKNVRAVTPKSSYVLKTHRRGPNAPLLTFPRGSFVEDYEYDESKYISGGHLDECLGHKGPTPEFPDSVYHYHILEDTETEIGFPYIGRCYRLFKYDEGPNTFPR